MVQQALNRHSRVVIPPETKFFFSFLGHCRQCQDRHLARLNADLRISLPRPAAPIRSAAEGRAFYEMMARQYVERVGKKDVALFGEKTPEHSTHLPRIRQLFPSARIVILHRDGRDVASSLSRMPWMTPDVNVNFLVWLYYCRALRRATAGAGPNVCHARYEDIVTNPAREFGRILAFLGLPYEPAVAEGWGNREGVPEREYPWKERALAKITTDRVGTFLRDLSAAQIAVLERLGRNLLPELGYPLLTDGRAPLSPGLLLKLAGGLARFVYRLPWHAVVRELLGLSLLCTADDSSEGSCPLPALA